MVASTSKRCYPSISRYWLGGEPLEDVTVIRGAAGHGRLPQEVMGRFTVMDASGDESAAQVRRIRALPVDQVIADVVFSLLQAAQVKLGRRDARLLIDVSTVAHEHARPYLPGELTRQIDQALGELRLAQVGAEGQASTSGQPEHNDLEQVPAPPPASAARPPAGQATGNGFN